MDKALQEYYESRFDKGWKDLIEDVHIIIKSYNNVLAVSDEKDLYTKKGQLDILNWLVSLKETSNKAWEELNDK